MSARGSHRPAKNIMGKNTRRPMTLAAFAVRAIAAISSPIGKSPAADSATATMSPAGLLGAGDPNAAIATAIMMTIAVTATHSWTRPWAISIQDRGTGVVDRRRRSPSSR